MRRRGDGTGVASTARTGGSSPDGRKRRVPVAVGGTIGIYLGFLVLQPVFRVAGLRVLELTPWTRRFVPLRPELPEPWPGVFEWLALPAVRTTLFAVALAALFGLYLGAYRGVLAGERVSRRAILLVFLAYSAVLVPSLPLFSVDVFAYVAHGELVDVKGVSPYEVRMEDHRDLVAARYAPRMRLGSVYGPLALRVFQALHFEGLGPFANLLVFKIFSVLVLLASFELVFRTGTALGREASKARAALLLVAWNPLVLLDGVMNAHVDVIILGLFALGTFLVVRGATVVGLAVLASTAAVKIVFLFVVPVILVHAFASADRRRSGVLRVAGVVALGAALNLVWYLPDWLHGSPLEALSELRNYAASSATFVVRRLIRGFGFHVPLLPVIVSGVFAAVVILGIWRVRDLPRFLRRISRDGLLWLLVFTSVTQPWYALPLFPLALAGGARRHVAALLVFSACAPLSSYGMRLAEGMFTDTAKFVNFFVGVLPAAIVFLAGSRADRALRLDRWMPGPGGRDG